MSAGQSVKAMMKGRMRMPKGMRIKTDSQGDKPAFLQMNQKGRTPTATKAADRMRTMMTSGVPRGPMEARSRWWIDMVVGVGWGAGSFGGLAEA